MKFTVESQQKFQGIEFTFTVEGISKKIKGRITETLDEKNEQPFYWEISHYYNHHYPSVRDAGTFHEAYQLMTGYLVNMCVPLEENDRY